MARVLRTGHESSNRLTCDLQDILADFTSEDNDDFYRPRHRFKPTRNIAYPNLARVFAHHSYNRYTIQGL